jgi:hypothetical protein
MSSTKNGNTERNVDRCPGCGHNYYDDRPVKNGYCKWCVEEGVYSPESLAAVHARIQYEHQRRQDAEQEHYNQYLRDNDGDPWGYTPLHMGVRTN